MSDRDITLDRGPMRGFDSPLTPFGGFPAFEVRIRTIYDEQREAEEAAKEPTNDTD